MTRSKEKNILIDLLSDSDLTDVEKSIRKIRNFCIELLLCFQIQYNGRVDSLKYVASIYKNNSNKPLIHSSGFNMMECLNELIIKLEELYQREKLGD